MSARSGGSGDPWDEGRASRTRSCWRARARCSSNAASRAAPVKSRGGQACRRRSCSSGTRRRPTSSSRRWRCRRSISRRSSTPGSPARDRLASITAAMIDYFRDSMPVLLPLLSPPVFQFEQFSRRHPDSPLSALRRGLVAFFAPRTGGAPHRPRGPGRGGAAGVRPGAVGGVLRTDGRARRPDAGPRAGAGHRSSVAGPVAEGVERATGSRRGPVRTRRGATRPRWRSCRGASRVPRTRCRPPTALSSPRRP